MFYHQEIKSYINRYCVLFEWNPVSVPICIVKFISKMMRKVREIAKNFDFMKSGQAIMSARKKQRITQEELAGELGISARHLQ